MSKATTFALALQQMDGIGRVTAGRLLHHFASYDDLLRYPREQVLIRIKGVPNAETLVQQLFDEAAMRTRLEQAAQQEDELDQKRVALLAPGDERWPAALDDLPRSQRPFLLYTYGALDVLERPLVALFARPPLQEASFERAQALVRRLLSSGVMPGTGVANGFDVVVHRLATTGSRPHPSLLVAACGLARIPPPMRPTVSAVAHAGGLCCSPFPMTHGTFEHDDRERALVLAALAQACVFVDPQADTPEGRTLNWAQAVDRPAFVIAAEAAGLPAHLAPLAVADDFDRVLAASGA